MTNKDDDDDDDDDEVMTRNRIHYFFLNTVYVESLYTLTTLSVNIYNQLTVKRRKTKVTETRLSNALATWSANRYDCFGFLAFFEHYYYDVNNWLDAVKGPLCEGEASGRNGQRGETEGGLHAATCGSLMQSPGR